MVLESAFNISLMTGPSNQLLTSLERHSQRKNYSHIEKKTLGIISAIANFYRFIHGRHFKLQTEYKPLVTIYGSKKGLPANTANKLERWGNILLNYNFKIAFVPSGKLSHADGLSRLIPKYKEPLEDRVNSSLREEDEIKKPYAMPCGNFQLPLTKLGEKCRTANS